MMLRSCHRALCPGSPESRAYCSCIVSQVFAYIQVGGRAAINLGSLCFHEAMRISAWTSQLTSLDKVSRITLESSSVQCGYVSRTNARPRAKCLSACYITSIHVAAQARNTVHTLGLPCSERPLNARPKSSKAISSASNLAEHSLPRRRSCLLPG